MGRRRACTLTLVLGWVVPAAAASQELVTDRPDFTESAQTVPAGMRQLEAGYTLARHNAASAHALGELLLRVALGSRLEARLAPGTLAWNDGGSAAVQDVGVGAKLALTGNGGALMGGAAALLVGTGVPVKSGGTLEPEGKLLLGWDLPGGLGLGANLNAAWLRDEAGGYWEPSGSASLSVPLGGAWGGYVEAYGFAPEARGSTAFLNGGVTWAFGPALQLDARVGARVDRSGERFIGLGLARRW
jgi:hypothetical protein